MSSLAFTEPSGLGFGARLLLLADDLLFLLLDVDVERLLLLRADVVFILLPGERLVLLAYEVKSNPGVFLPPLALLVLLTDEVPTLIPDEAFLRLDSLRRVLLFLLLALGSSKARETPLPNEPKASAILLLADD